MEHNNVLLPRSLVDINFPFNALVNIIHSRPSLGNWFDLKNDVDKLIVKDIQRYYKQLTTGQVQLPSHSCTKSWIAAELKDNGCFRSIVNKVLGRTNLQRLMHSGLFKCRCEEQFRRDASGEGHVMDLTSMGSTNRSVNSFFQNWLAECQFCHGPRNLCATPSFMFLSFPESAGTIVFEDVLFSGTTFNHVATLYRGRDEQCWLEVLNSNPVWTLQWLRIADNVVTVTEKRNELQSDGLCIAVYERRP